MRASSLRRFARVVCERGGAGAAALALALENAEFGEMSAQRRQLLLLLPHGTVSSLSFALWSLSLTAFSLGVVFGSTSRRDSRGSCV